MSLVSSSLAEELVLASVNGAEITKGTMRILSSSREQGPLSQIDNDRKQLLESLITTEVLVSAAKQINLESLTEISLELDLAYKTLLSQLYVAHYMAQLNIDEKELRQLYRQQVPQIMVRMEYWQFRDKAKAFSFIKQYEGAEASSIPSGEQDPWQLLQHYAFYAETLSAKLDSGDWVNEPVKSSDGWQVWRCLEKKVIPKPDFMHLKEGLKQEIAHKRLQEHIEELRAKAEIKRNI